jgi:hypothetical protein
MRGSRLYFNILIQLKREEIQMPINYYLRENKLTQEEGDYMANVRSSRQVDLEDVIKRMGERGSTVTKADILSVMEDFEGALESLLAEGANVTTPFANFSTSIRGVFDGATDSFDPSRHQITLIVHPGKNVRAYFKQNVSPQKEEKADKGPNLIDFVDNNSGEHNSILTPGGLGTLIGNRLSYDPEDQNQGVFFIAEDGAETQVAIIGQNKPSMLVFIIPETLSSGDYFIELRNTTFKKLKSGRLSSIVSVA